jgi:hypothetical protein
MNRTAREKAGRDFHIANPEATILDARAEADKLFGNERDQVAFLDGWIQEELRLSRQHVFKHAGRGHERLDGEASRGALSRP